MNKSANLAKFIAERKYCDVSVQVNENEIRAHRVVLAAGSSNLLDEDATIKMTNFKD